MVVKLVHAFLIFSVYLLTVNTEIKNKTNYLKIKIKHKHEIEQWFDLNINIIKIKN